MIIFEVYIDFYTKAEFEFRIAIWWIRFKWKTASSKSLQKKKMKNEKWAKNEKKKTGRKKTVNRIKSCW